jgi:hypothetical protein
MQCYGDPATNSNGSFGSDVASAATLHQRNLESLFPIIPLRLFRANLTYASYEYHLDVESIRERLDLTVLSREEPLQVGPAAIIVGLERFFTTNTTWDNHQSGIAVICMNKWHVVSGDRFPKDYQNHDKRSNFFKFVFANTA